MPRQSSSQKQNKKRRGNRKGIILCTAGIVICLICFEISDSKNWILPIVALTSAILYLERNSIRTLFLEDRSQFGPAAAWYRLFFWALDIIGVLAGLYFSEFHIAGSNDLMNLGLPYAAIIPALAIPIAFYFVIRGSATKPKSNEFLVTTIALSLFSVFLTPMGLVAGANQVFDHSPPVDVERTVLSKNQTHSAKGHVTFTLDVDGWIKPEERVSIHIPRDTFIQVRPLVTPIVLQTHTGALGIPWISAILVLQK